MALIRTHTKNFTDGVVTLRPMTDDDLPLLYRWNEIPRFCISVRVTWIPTLPKRWILSINPC
ncbi:MAG: hypothetical protein II337_02390, partial [Clostridia bacterium]|nr:hypothetical protein [Clostridia bacterium]